VSPLFGQFDFHSHEIDRINRAGSGQPCGAHLGRDHLRLPVNRTFAQGAEIALRAKLQTNLRLNSTYTNTSSQYLDNPAPADPTYNPGRPLLRRPKHSATLLLSQLGARWGANLGGSFVGERSDSDFFGFGVNHAAGYVRADVDGWYAIRPCLTAYFAVENALDRRYNEGVGYPALPVNFRAGMCSRIGGE
jgi:outer membrane receptor protein involved in Fe transport